MAKTLSIKSITAADIKRRHPRGLTCETDKQYARLANDIYDMIHERLTVMEVRYIEALKYRYRHCNKITKNHKK
jgi:hypothetical protein